MIMATTVQAVSEKKKTPKLRLPSWYDPNSPEVKERRRKLFAALNAEHSPEGVAAMDRIAKASMEPDDAE